MSGLDEHSPRNPQHPQHPQKPLLKLISACAACSAVVVLSAAAVGCGKKGPPLPPLVRIPSPPADFTAERRGDHVELQFTVPAANTDNSKPANIERVDVYGFTGPATVPDADVLKYGGRVGSVDVKAPRDPNQAADPEEGESEADVEPPAGNGLDQGARGVVEERITTATLAPVQVTKREKPGAGVSDGPMVGPAIGAPARTYVSVGITTRGRKGALSKRVTVPLVSPPPAPPAPAVTYTESEVDVTWPASAPVGSGDVLPSRRIGETMPTFGYNVYQVPGPSATKGATEIRLTTATVGDPRFADRRITWGEERCYAVRAVEQFGGTTVESEASPSRCVTLTDTFAPAPPKGLTAVASQGAISLIWEPNTEADLAGYIVLRGTAPGEALAPVTPTPLAETTFKDNVQPGIRFMYAVRAVDKAGNMSEPSAKVEETAR